MLPYYFVLNQSPRKAALFSDVTAKSLTALQIAATACNDPDNAQACKQQGVGCGFRDGRFGDTCVCDTQHCGDELIAILYGDGKVVYYCQ
ncbi:hypothetical protein AGMMS49543_27040 [Betaproteobacteria bacterium]|nr:hypothetical protein AGMMS49543_27040 [Betaproteobacteria bacterium]GHU15984.1 hypothetical protein AGMMS50243_01040 [Betaproteobacteria bacterium]